MKTSWNSAKTLQISFKIQTFHVNHSKNKNKEEKDSDTREGKDMIQKVAISV